MEMIQEILNNLERVKELSDIMSNYIVQNDALIKYHLEKIKIMRLINNNTKNYVDQNVDLINNMILSTEYIKNIMVANDVHNM